jgi:hypothetical protein
MGPRSAQRVAQRTTCCEAHIVRRLPSNARDRTHDQKNTPYVRGVYLYLRRRWDRVAHNVLRSAQRVAKRI